MPLVVDGLTKRFGRILALDSISWTAEPGQVFGFLGANGAGKTTTMRIVLGILRPDSGRVTWQGRDTRSFPRRTWGYLPEERGLYPRMAVLDQLAYFASLHGLSPRDARRRAGEWLERFRMSELAGRRADELSKGNQQKVQFISAVLHEPDALLMDEPFTGLDPVNVKMLREAFVELRDQGRAIVFSTHQMEAAEALCDAIAIVDRGRVVVGGPLAEVKRRSGATEVRLVATGDHGLEWLTSLPGAIVVRRGPSEREVVIPWAGDAHELLAAAMNAGVRVARFETAEPTLEELFVRHVGRPVGDGAVRRGGHGDAARSASEGSTRAAHGSGRESASADRTKAEGAA